MMRKGSRKKANAEAQARYRERQKSEGIPTASVVAMATFRILLSGEGQRKDTVRNKIEDLIVDYLVRRYPDYTERGVEHRFGEMIDEAQKWRSSGWFDTDIRRRHCEDQR
jgi:hypothetical protein